MSLLEHLRPVKTSVGHIRRANRITIIPGALALRPRPKPIIPLSISIGSRQFPSQYESIGPPPLAEGLDSVQNRERHTEMKSEREREK